MSDFTTKQDISDYTDYMQRVNIAAYMLVDEVTTSLYYIGTSRNGNYINKPVWQIRKISKIGNVWHIAEYPHGDQDFKYVWNNRAGYTYQ